MEPRHRHRLEEWIPDEMDAVHELCHLYAIPLRDWPDHRAFTVFVDLAVRRWVEEILIDGRARSETRALEIIAGQVGLRSDTVRRRWFRRRNAA